VRFSYGGALPDFDFAVARDALAGDAALAAEVVEVFVKQIPTLLDRLETAVGARDLAALAAEGHSLKGSILATSAGPVTSAAVAVETRARAGEVAAAITEALALSRALRSLVCVLSRLQP
jgi:HPt (histidine-containing phosphotransfer) domain-containing protein